MPRALPSIAATLGLLSLLACGGATPPGESPPEAAAPAPSPGAAPEASAPAPSAEAIATPSAPQPSATPAAPAAKRGSNENILLGRLSEADVQDRIMKSYRSFDPCLPDSYKKNN